MLLAGADASVVRRTQAHLQAAGRPPVYFAARFLLANRYYAYLTAAVGLTMAALAKYSWGRALLLRCVQRGTIAQVATLGNCSHAKVMCPDGLTSSSNVSQACCHKSQYPPYTPSRFPSFFSVGAISHAGPSRRQAAATTSVTTLVARGFSNTPPDHHLGSGSGYEAGSGSRSGAGSRALLPDREVVLRITGPDPGYKATAIFLVQVWTDVWGAAAAIFLV